MISFPLNIKAIDGSDYQVVIWSGEHIGNEIALDTETNMVPFHTRLHKLVVFQAYSGGSTIYLVRKKHLQRFLNLHAKSKIIGQNIPFDIQVLMHEVSQESLLQFYDNNLVYDTKILYSLYVLATVGQVPDRKATSLKTMYKTIFGYDIDKNGSIRTTFDQYMDMPYEEMSIDHVGYASLDVVYTFNLYCKLLAMIQPHDTMNTLLSAHIQVKGDLVLDQIYKNGIGIDLESKSALANQLETQLAHINERLCMWGIVDGKSGSQGQYERAVARLGIIDKLPTTATGKVSSKASDLEPFQYIPFISDYVNASTYEKLMSFLVNLKDTVIHPTYTTILNTGRTATQSGHNGLSIHQIPKSGGVRELLVPKNKGHVFIDTDYAAIELAGLSQVLISLYGQSRMAEIINTGKDLHIATAVSVYKKPEDEITREERQFSKIPNFAFPTNMAPSTFIDYCKQYKVSVTEDEARNVKEAWLDTFPEMNKYFSDMNGKEDGINQYGKRTYTHYTLTGRKRAHCTYTAYLNTGFQGLCADGLKIAMYNLFKLGYHITTEIHDQILIEVPRDGAEAHQEIIKKVMIDSMKIVIPDVLVAVESQILERFTK